MKIKFHIVAALMAVTFISLSFNGYVVDYNTMDNEPWVAPDKYKNMKNPVAADSKSISLGKELYEKHCKSCHGKEGLGDGPKAAQLDTPSGDFTDENFQAQSDGSLFYKTIEGRGDMPGFKKKIPYEEDLWSIINYIRTME